MLRSLLSQKNLADSWLTCCKAHGSYSEEVILKHRSNYIILLVSKFYIHVHTSNSFFSLQVPVNLDLGPVNVTINESSAASFQCLASGDPKPTVTWYKGDNRLVAGGRIVIGGNNLTILQTTPLDTGHYSCNVSNGLAFDIGKAFLLVQGTRLNVVMFQCFKMPWAFWGWA